jgi:HEAT repeat protein
MKMCANKTVAILASWVLLAGPAWGQEQKAAPAPSSKVSEAVSHLNKANLLYQQKKYDLAAAEIEEALKLQPSSSEIVEMRDQVGEATLIAMLNNPKLRDQVRGILRLAEQETLHKQTDPAEIQKLVKALESEDFTVYWKAITELIVVGDFAVPYVLQPLCDAKPTHASSLAAVTLTRMGWKAVPALVEALKSDNVVLRQNVCGVMGAIGDIRTLAPLKAICENEQESPLVRSEAARALEKMTGRDAKSLPAAGDLFYSLAEKYYRGDYKVVHAMVEPTMLVWRWEAPKAPAGEKAAAPAVPDVLKYYCVPRYLYTRLMVEDACLAGLAAAPSDTRIIDVLVAAYYNAIGEISVALRGYQVSNLGFKFTAEELKTLEAMAAATRPWGRLAEATGSKHINAALERALAEGNGPMAGACIEGLRNVGDDSPQAGVSGLIAAMGNPDKFVRYAAAEALVSIARRGGLGGEALAMRVLSAALTENPRRTILLVQSNSQLTNALKAVLRVGDFNVVECTSMNAAVAQIGKIFTPVDIIVLEHAIGSSDTISFARRLKTGATVPNVGIIVTSNRDADEMERAYGRYADSILADASAAAQLMEKVQALLSRPEVKMDEKAVVLATRRNAAQVVAALDPETTSYPAKELLPALKEMLGAEDELLRADALTALGKIGDPCANEEIVKIVSDPKQSDKLRQTALIALGSIFEQTRKVTEGEYNAVKDALKDPKVCAQAAVALGKAGLGPKTLSPTLIELRPPAQSLAVGAPAPAAGAEETKTEAAPAEKKEEGAKKE